MSGHLKTKSEYFQAVIDGRKPMEIRKNDRNFKMGDRYILEEFKGIQKIPTCPDCGNCPAYQYIYDEEEAVRNCPIFRESCSSYQKEVYTGRRCLIRIKEVFPLDKAGLPDFVAFTFDILNIIDHRKKERTTIENPCSL